MLRDEKIKKRILLIILFFIFISLTIAGCAVTKTVMIPVSKDEDYTVNLGSRSMTTMQKGIKVTMRYPSLEELRKIENAPFTTFNRTHFTVFFITVENLEEEED